jgi:hypothetical protein
MSISAEAMRFLLNACMVGLAIVAMLFLARRKMSLLAYLGWGLLIVLLPLIGPFLVVFVQPGNQRGGSIKG